MDLGWDKHSCFIKFSDLKGKIILSISGCQDQSEQVLIKTTDGIFILEHTQDCCESVYLEDIVGSPSDLCGAYVSLAEESLGDAATSSNESATWTFYNICTPKGDLQLRWYGTSSGYYSETVNTYFYSSKFLGQKVRDKIKEGKKFHDIKEFYDILSKEDKIFAMFNLDILLG